VTKAQKIIVLVAAVLLAAAILYPPYNLFTIAVGTEPPQWQVANSEWTWITNMGASQEMFNGNSLFVYRKVRFGTLIVEIFGILVLASAAFLITKRTKRN